MRVSVTGTLTEFDGPTANNFPNGICAGPDGAIWFTEVNAGQIGRLTTAGVFTEFPIPTANADPHSIKAGPDGALWFTERARQGDEGGPGRIMVP